jgi:acetyl-CoA carboxylase carboxyl transferase subunit alpha
MKKIAKESNKTAFERVQTARQMDRPYTMDLVEHLFSDFTEIHGDRRYSDDPALVCGFANLDGQPVVVIGQQKGRDTNQRRFRNFGMPKPEGYRKAMRVMKFAEKFGRPIISFIDTPGAYPGIDAEERGQAEAIAFNLREMSSLRVPVVAVVIGEGGSGGALAIGIGDRVVMMENSVYSVITPEGCAAILWKSAAKADQAAAALRLTASDLRGFGLIDEIVAEKEPWAVSPDGADGIKSSGAFEKIAADLKTRLISIVGELTKMNTADLLKQRYDKFRAMGQYSEAAVRSEH